MTTTVPPAARHSAAAAHAVDPSSPGAAPAGGDALPSARGLAHDLVVVLLLRARRHARWGRTAVRAVGALWGGGWRCAAQVAVIVLASCAVAWLVWDSTEQQRQSGAQPAFSGEGRLEGSLADTDVTADLEAQRGAAPGAPGGGRSDEPAGDPAAGGSSSSSSGGWFMSFAAVSAVLLAGAGAAVLVVRRHRRRSVVPAEQVDLPTLQELCDLLPRDEPAEDDGADDGPLPETDVEDRVIDVADDPTEPRTADPTAAVLTASTAGLAAADPAASSWSSSGVASGLFGGDSALVVGENVGSRIETRQRLYERRAAPRVDFVRPGLMLWRSAQCDITTRDLSGTGLRLRVSAPGASPLPASGDYVQVDFPVDGGQVRVTAQVAWRRATPEGTELGVVFRPLAAEDEQRIRETCAART